MPAYMAGMVEYGTRLLEGTYGPSNGYRTFQQSLPPEWQSSSAPASSRGVIGAWSGGCADAASRRLYFAGGGHSDGANNGIHLFDFSGDTAPSGFGVLDGSRSDRSAVVDDMASPSADGSYLDGRPSAVHTYSGMQYDRVRNRVWRGGSAIYSSGRPTGAHLWQFDIASGTWAKRVGGGPVAAYTLLLQAPDASKVLMLGDFGGNRFVDADNFAVTQFGSVPWSGTDQNVVGAYDSTRDRFLTIARTTQTFNGPENPLRFHTLAVDWTRNTFAFTQRTPVGSPAVISQLKGGMGLFYDAARDSFWGFGSRDDMAAGAIDKLIEIRADTFEVTMTPLYPALPCGTYSRGTFGRFIWMPEYRTIGLVYDFDKPAAIIRLP